MRRLLVLAVAAMFAFGVMAFASEAQTKAMEKGDHAKGTITAWDEGTKTMKVKDKDGKEWTFEWNDQTMVHGAPKVGEMVKLDYSKDKDGKMLASHVYVGKEEIGKAKAAKKE
ncbi:MAG TPA: hypothetical protein VGK94_03575 [Candidatus Polarisedimenticolia bacterium]|jgi:hypothetical protein